MSLDKAINSGKEHRKPYRGCKAFDYTTRNHGSDTFMAKARTFFDRRRRAQADEDMREGEQGSGEEGK